MAHAAEISVLADKLVTSLTKLTAEDDGLKFKRAKLTVARGLKSAHFLRVNQFDIEERYDGLEEKFVVLNRDDIAIALKQRRYELSHAHSKWKPEILALLLYLSDRPVENNQSVQLSRESFHSSPPELTWEEILADDPLDEPGIWEDIDYGVASSDDEQSVTVEKSTPTQLPSATFFDDSVEHAAVATEVDIAGLVDLRQNRYWQKSNPQLATPREDHANITELQAVRETLHMLGGSPTSLYTVFNKDEPIAPSSAWNLSHTSSAQFHSVLSDFSAVGNDLFRLRNWTSHSQSVPLMQALQYEIGDRLNVFDQEIVDLHASYVHTSKQMSVSLQWIYSLLEQRTRSLRLLSSIIVQMASLESGYDYIFLEQLFDSIGLAQQVGDSLVHEELALVFFNCLGTYMRPVRRWMEAGQLDLNTDGFFIATRKDVVDRNQPSIWHDHFELQYDDSGNVRAPEFLRLAVHRIFNAGKSVYFLGKLGLQPERTLGPVSDEPKLDYATVCGNGEAATSSLQPFRQQFQQAFDCWTNSKLNSASLVLRDELFTIWGLWQSLDAIEYLYLNRDGHLFQAFADRVFERFDRKLRIWNDVFVLTDIARSVFGEVVAVESARVSVKYQPANDASRPAGSVASFAIEYKMSWALSEIVQRKSIRVYQSVAQLLLKAYRAKFVLQDCKSLNVQFSARATDASVQRALGLRQRLICFTDTLRAYLTELAVPEETRRMRAKLRDAVDLDAMAVAHVEYMNRLESVCFLTSKLGPLRRAIMAILDMAAELGGALRDIVQGPSKKGDLMRTDRRQMTKERDRRRQNRHRTDALSSDDDEQESDSMASEAENEGTHILDLETVMRHMSERLNSLMPFVGDTLTNLAKSSDEFLWSNLADRIRWQVELPITPNP